MAAFLVCAALAASLATAAASSFDFASALAVSSWFPSSAALAAAFCLRSSARALASSVLAAASALSAEASSASARALSPSSLRSDAVSDVVSRVAVAAAFFASSAVLAASAASRGSASALAGAAAIASAVRHQQRRMGELDRLGVIRRDDHPHPDPRPVEQLFGKAKRHPHAAVRGRIAGQRPAVQRDAVPGDALHVRHRGVVIHGRAVILFLFDDREDAGRRLASRGAGRHRRAQDPALGVVQSDVLGLDRHDRHDRLARIARSGRLLEGRGARLSRCGVGDQRRQGGHRRERHDGRRTPTPRRHGGSRRPGSICHVMPWSRCLSVLPRCIHDSPRRTKRGPLPHLAPFIFAWRRRDPHRRHVDPDRRLEPPLLFCSGPAPGTAIGSPECAGSAAAGKAAGHGPAQASCRSYSGHAAVRTDLRGAVLPRHSAAGDNHRI